jgi:phage tail sheath protein FI
MAFNVGINVLETDGKATPSIVGAAVSIGAYLIRSARGVPLKVYRVTSMGQVKEAFGPPIDGAFGYYALKGFFDNGGGLAYVSRIVDEDEAVAASKAFGDVTVTAAYRDTADPGAWGNRVSIRIADNPSVADTFDLFVRFDGKDVEAWERLTNVAAPATPARNAVATVNDGLTGSKYIRLATTSATNPDSTDTGTPVVATFVALEDGEDDGLDAAGLEAAITDEWSRFDAYDVQLLACPEVNTRTVVDDALTYCAIRGDCVYLGFTSQDDDLEAAITYGQQFRANKVYGAIYFPWIQVAKETGGQIWVPPVGHVMGVYARTESERGIWKAPAGVQALVRGALDARQRIGDLDHTDLVKNGSVNAIRFVPGAGFIVDSSRTPSVNPLWYYVNVRLLFNYVKSSLRRSLRWVVQEPNNEELWQKVAINSVRPFLMGLWRKGAFGPGKADDVFTIKCDAENNPPENIQQGIFTLEVYFYPSRPAETVVIIVGQQEGKSSASEA